MLSVSVYSKQCFSMWFPHKNPESIFLNPHRFKVPRIGNNKIVDVLICETGERVLKLCMMVGAGKASNFR
jgi:hypothetical protein